MKTFKQFFIESQEHTSADTSLNQVSAGLKHAVSKSLIKPNSVNVDVGGGKYDVGKSHVEKSVEGSKLHVYDPYNRKSEHNKNIEDETTGKAHYVGLHNVLNVIKEPESRKSALEKVKSFMKPGEGVAHITVHEGDKSGNGRMSKSDKGRGSSWQNHRPTSSYVGEVSSVFPEHTYDVRHSGKNIVVSHKK